MKLTDDLKAAKQQIETAINEAQRTAEGRVAGAGVNYALQARLRGEIPQKGDGQKAS